MAGTLTEAEVLVQLQANDVKYLDTITGDVKTSMDAKVAAANASHTAKTNAELATGINKTTVSGNIINADVYDGGNVVTPVNATWMEQQVKDALDNDLLHHTGGAYTTDYVPLSPYYDPLWLIEGQKLTGESYF
jgi:hypothetical protein